MSLSPPGTSKKRAIAGAYVEGFHCVIICSYSRAARSIANGIDNKNKNNNNDDDDDDDDDDVSVLWPKWGA